MDPLFCRSSWLRNVISWLSFNHLKPDVHSSFNLGLTLSVPAWSLVSGAGYLVSLEKMGCFFTELCFLMLTVMISEMQTCTNRKEVSQCATSNTCMVPFFSLFSNACACEIHGVWWLSTALGEALATPSGPWSPLKVW